MADRRPKLGDILIQGGLITKEQLDKALEAQRKGSKENIGTILISMGIVTEKEIAVTLSKQLNIPYASLQEGLELNDDQLSKIVPEEFARKNTLLPIKLVGDELTVAMVDPTNIILLDDLRLMTGVRTVRRVVATRGDVLAMIDRFYGAGGMFLKAVEASRESELQVATESTKEQISLDSLVEAAETAPVIKMVDLILRQAIKERASDIHIEPFADSFSIRVRVDGALHDIPPPAKSMALPIVSRIKILSKMDIAEKRLPQDGSFTATMDQDRKIDFRVSSIPTIHGEKLVIRILDRTIVSLDFEALGFQKKDLELFRKMIHRLYGLILVTGPTGSGKSTTLYASLNEIKTTDKNILTIEDPVEYQIKGISQVQARPEIGLTFAAGLRSFLRQDPDIIFVGEIRDLETAQIAIRAALTGHLVFSTLHTNDAASSLSRLVDVGLEPFYVNAALAMVVAQRLVRRLCPHCKAAYEPPPSSLPKYFGSFKGTLYKSAGCEKCSKTGFMGRMAIYEILAMNDALAELVYQKAPISAIRQMARKQGMKTMEENGYERVLKGETTLEEVQSATMVD